MRKFHSFGIICIVFAIISQFCYYFNCFLDIQLDTLDFRRGYQKLDMWRYTFDIIQSTLYINSVIIHYVALFVQ